jgi:hypothetical protein
MELTLEARAMEESGELVGVSSWTLEVESDCSTLRSLLLAPSCENEKSDVRIDNIVQQQESRVMKRGPPVHR